MWTMAYIACGFVVGLYAGRKRQQGLGWLKIAKDAVAGVLGLFRRGDGKTDTKSAGIEDAEIVDV